MEYTVIKSKRKSLSITIDDNCNIIVKAPNWINKKVIDDFVFKNSEWINKAVQRKEVELNNKITLAPEEIATLKKAAEYVLCDKVSYYAEIMKVFPTDVKITSAKKRFGSCSGKNSICFSYLLMLYPDDAIDYVVVHELAHIKHHNHGKDFYNLIKEVMPDYKDREKMLNSKQKIPSFIKDNYF